MADSLDSGSSAHYGRAGSSPASRTKKERHPHGCLSFLELHFCYAKVVACGRVIEREWVNPSKVPPSHSPFLAMCRGADNKICTQSQKKHYLSGGCFLFGIPRADANSLPRPARSALNQEVRQGSCEWLCHSWDAGSESSLVACSQKKHHMHCIFYERSGFVNREPSGRAAPSVKPDKRSGREAMLPSREDTKEFTCPLPQT